MAGQVNDARFFRWLSAAVIAVVTVLAGLVAVPGTARAVVGGSPVAEGVYPFVVAVDVGAFGGCSGVLVDAEWVVTVRACLPEVSVHGMPPPTGTAVSIGGARIAVEEVFSHPTLGVVLLRLASPVAGVTPVVLGGAPVVGETLRVAGYGRTSDVWAPERLHTAAVSVGQVTDGGFTIVAAGVTTCQGDAGGAALREVGGQVQLVGVHDGSGQGGCLGATGSDMSGSEVRVDRLADWIRQHVTHPRPVPDLSRNMALDATFTASSSAEFGSWFLANINDGDRVATGWTSWPAAASPRTEWLELAFPSGAARQVNRVDLYPRTDVPVAENNFPVNLTIKAWNGAAWETVVSRTNLPRTASGQRFTFPTRSTTKLRIEGANLLIMQVKEVDVYLSANLAADATFTASSSGEFGTWFLHNVNDSTRELWGWTSWPQATSPRSEWLEFAFPGGAARQLNRVDLYPRTDLPAAESNFPANFTIQVWTGTAWETVVTRTNYPKPASGQRFTFPTKTTTKVRVTGTNLLIMQLKEVEAYLSGNVAADATVATSSSGEFGTWRRIDVNDGIRDEPGWTSWPDAEPGHTEWVELAFPGGAARQVNRVDVYPRPDMPAAQANFPLTMNVQVWTGSQWETVAARRRTLPFTSVGPVSLAFPARSTTKLRVEGLNLTIMQLAEVEAYHHFPVAAVAPAAEPLPPIVEKRVYPGAAQILAEHGLKVFSGDGRVLFVTSHPIAGGVQCDPGQIQVEMATATPPYGVFYCFRTIGTRGYLTLEVPGTFLVRGGSLPLQATATLSDGTEQTYEIPAHTPIPIDPGNEPELPKAVLVELRIG